MEIQTIDSASELAELTWQTWIKCFWWTLITIATIKAFIYPYGQTKVLKWIKGKPLLDLVRGFGITSLVVLLGVDIVPIAEWIGWDLGKVGSVLNKIAENPIKMSVVVAILVQVLIYRWRRKKTPGRQVYGETDPKTD